MIFILVISQSFASLKMFLFLSGWFSQAWLERTLVPTYFHGFYILHYIQQARGSWLGFPHCKCVFGIWLGYVLPRESSNLRSTGSRCFSALGILSWYRLNFRVDFSIYFLLWCVSYTETSLLGQLLCVRWIYSYVIDPPERIEFVSSNAACIIS